MPKRNLTFLIIIILSLTLLSVGILYFRPDGATPPSTESEGTNFFAKFNPFRKNNPGSSPDGTIDISGDMEVPGEREAQKLSKISSVPVAGFAVFQKERLIDIPDVIPPTDSPDGPDPDKIVPVAPPTEFVPALRYVDRITGNIFQTFADNIEERKFTTTTIPKVYEAFFGNSAQSVVMRYLKPDGRTIETFLGTLPKEYLGADSVESNELKGTFLPDNITDVSISPDSSRLFYLYNSGNSVVGTVLEFSDNKKTPVFNSAFTEWLPQWPSGGLITLTTKPSSSVFGYMYSINLLNGNSFNKTLGTIAGLTTLTSPDGKLTLYTDSSLSLSVYNNESRTSVSLGVRTLPEKCVWAKANDNLYCAVPKTIELAQYPDSWYQGEVSFNDEIWTIDPYTASTLVLLDPIRIPYGEEIDGIKLALDLGENYLFLVNKKDSFLWKVNLK